MTYVGHEEVLRGRALRYVEYLCRNMHSLEPQPKKATFARFFAMLSHLMQLYIAQGTTAGTIYLYRPLVRCSPWTYTSMRVFASRP
jgi:hypothetical protein